MQQRLKYLGKLHSRVQKEYKKNKLHFVREIGSVKEKIELLLYH
jgi:hypothetical protein